MSVQVERLEEKNMVKLTIEVSAEDFADACKEAYNKQKKNINIPGFRKGKVPMNVVEKMYGAGVFYEDAADICMNTAYPQAIDEIEETIVSRPQVDEVLQMEKGKPFIFTVKAAVKPEVTLGEYKGVEVTKADTTVTDADVEIAVQAELKKNSRMVSVERAIESGDTAVIDYVGTVDGVAFEGGSAENHNLVIGSGSFIPGFEDQLIGHAAGEEVEVNVTFPEEYHAENLAGQAAVFTCKINEVKTEEIPELDDDFASDVSEFDTVDEYKENLKKELAEKKEQAAKDAQKSEALAVAVANAQMDIPEAMIDLECEGMINQFAQQMAQQGLSLEQYFQFTGQTMDALKAQVRPNATDKIKSDLVLEAVAKAENIVASDEDVDAEIDKMAAMYNMEADQLKQYMGEEEKEQMKKELAVSKALDFLGENAVATKEPVVEEAPADAE